MSDSPKRPATLEELILAFFDEELNTDEQQRMAEMLAESTEARDLFRSYMRLEGVAVELGQASCLTSTAPRDEEQERERIDRSQAPAAATKPKQTALSIRWAKRIIAGGVALLLGVGLASLWNSRDSGPAESVGQISRIVAADWISPPEDVGSGIHIGTYELKDGLVELEFDNGATIILEGPASFEVASSEQTFLHFGRIRTRVPPQAYGFTIDTPAMTVVDLGTEFGLEIDSAGSAEVHVFDGEVEVYDQKRKKTDAPLLLSAGQAIRVDHSGQRSEIPADVDAFVDQLTLESRASAHVVELTDMLKAVHERQNQLGKRLKQAELAARRSNELQELRKAASEAKQRWISQQESHPELQKALAVRDQARSQLNQLYRDTMNQNDRGRQLLDRLEQANDELTELKQKLIEIKRMKEPAPELRMTYRQFRRVQKERSEARSQMRAYRSQLRSTNQKVREGNGRLVQARQRVDRLLRKPELDSLRVEAEKLQKIFLSTQRKRLQTDEQIAKLKRERNQIRQQVRILKRDIQRVES